MKPANKISKPVVYAMVIFFVIICIIPFYIMLINSTRSSSQINAGISFLPGLHFIKNYFNLVKRLNIARGILNSAFVAISATLLSSYISALTAYAFAFFKFPFKKLFFGFLLVSMMVPQQLGLIGYFELLNKLNLLDTFAGLILPAGANAFAVFFLTQYAKSVLPESIIHAARIDGAGEMSVFHKIVLPIMLPGIATMGIFTFVTNWNNYILPLVVIFSPEKYTVPVLIANLNTSTYKTDFGVVYLAIALSVIPILTVFAFLQRYLIAGISAGSIKE